MSESSHLLSSSSSPGRAYSLNNSNNSAQSQTVRNKKSINNNGNNNSDADADDVDRALDVDVDVDHRHYSPFTAYCFTVNYILGVGVLGVPRAFYAGGYLLSSVLLLTVTLAAIISAQYVNDTLVRAQIIHAHRTKDENTNKSLSGVLSRRFEVNELVFYFLGGRLSSFYSFCIVVYLSGSLWSYAAVFAQSFAEYAPLPFAILGCDAVTQSAECAQIIYVFYIFVFACIVVPLTCLDLTEMKALQISLALFRFFSLATMMITSVYAIYHYPLPTSTTEAAATHDTIASTQTSPPYFSDIQAVVWSGATLVFPVCIFGQIFHHSIPLLSHPVSPHSKPLLPRIYTGVLLTTALLYTLLGLTVGLYYGKDVRSVCTLNWVSYTGGASTTSPAPLYARIISYIVVMFPPLDIVSAYPLNAITLGRALLTSYVHSPHTQKQPCVYVPFRLLAAVPPILGAIFVKDLSPILKYTGCVGVIIAFIYPCLLQWSSTSMWQQEFSSSGASVLADTVHCIDTNGSVKRVQRAQGQGQGYVYFFSSSSWFSFSSPMISNSTTVLFSVFIFSAVGLAAVIVQSIIYQ